VEGIGKIEIYSKEGELVSSFPTSTEICRQLLSLEDRDALREVALMLSLSLKREGLNLSPEQILGELDRIVICGREIKVNGGDPAR